MPSRLSSLWRSAWALHRRAERALRTLRAEVCFKLRKAVPCDQAQGLCNEHKVCWSPRPWCGRRWTGDASQLNFDLRFPSYVHTSQHFTARPPHVPRGLHTASHAFADMSVDPVFGCCQCFPCRGCSLMSRWAPATTSATVPSPSTVTPGLPPCRASASLSPVLPSSITRARRQRRFAVPLGSEIDAEVFAPWPSSSLQRHLRIFQCVSGGVGIGRKERSKLHVSSLPCSLEGFQSLHSC